MAMKTVAAAKDVALIDLNADTLDSVQMIGCVAAKGVAAERIVQARRRVRR